ncbi:MAG: hypothetical protein ACYCSF_13820 [Acidimicrobiales bacterium]
MGSARSRTVRSRSSTEDLRPRRARCAVCARTSVLLPDYWLVRRADEVAVIGAARPLSARPHRGLQLEQPVPRSTTTVGTKVNRRDILDAVIHDYELAA